MRKTVGSALGRVDSNFGDCTQWPAVIFITRPDFTTFLHSSEVIVVSNDINIIFSSIL